MKNCSHTTDCETCASNAKMAKRLSNFVEQGFDRVLAQRDEALAQVEMHVADAAAARLLWRQSEAACAKMRADRDAAQQMVEHLSQSSTTSTTSPSATNATTITKEEP